MFKTDRRIQDINTAYLMARYEDFIRSYATEEEQFILGICFGRVFDRSYWN